MKSSIDRRIKGLDELRGIAILFVLTAHFFHFRMLDAQLEHFNIGGIGVDLFFMISTNNSGIKCFYRSLLFGC